MSGILEGLPISTAKRHGFQKDFTLWNIIQLYESLALQHWADKRGTANDFQTSVKYPCARKQKSRLSILKYTFQRTPARELLKYNYSDKYWCMKVFGSAETKHASWIQLCWHDQSGWWNSTPTSGLLIRLWWLAEGRAWAIPSTERGPWLWGSPGLRSHRG